MGAGIREEIKYMIMKFLDEKGKATWANTVATVANAAGVHQMYVEKIMGDLVQTHQLERHDGGGYPKYSVMSGPPSAPPGRIDGKYDSATEKRLEGMEEPTKSGTYEDDPRK